jgi:hypothetical protein
LGNTLTMSTGPDEYCCVSIADDAYAETLLAL